MQVLNAHIFHVSFEERSTNSFGTVIVFVLFIEISKVSYTRETQCNSLNSNLKIILNIL